MAYAQTIDLTSKAQREKREADPNRTPFDQPSEDAKDVAVEDLPTSLQDGIRSVGWDSLMPVQAKGLPYMLEGRDLVVQSRTGSGKTGAFLLPMLERLDPSKKEAQALVLCPTRELAKQIHHEFERMNNGRPEDLRQEAVAVYGGTAYGPQIDAFKRGAPVVIGTPGRVLDHLKKGTLRLDRLRMLVLDEADEMLSMGFFPDMLKLKRYLPKERDSYMFSATMPYQVQRVGQEFLDDPVFLAPQGGDVHVELMTHRVFHVEAMDKDRALVTLIEWENPGAAIVFANTRREVDYLSQFLSNFGYDAAPISSDFSQKQREEVMGRLRKGELRFLVATDVAARGIDISDLSHVIQYDLPQDREYFVHRAGRTARAGKSGVSISLVSSKEDEMILSDIVRRYDIPFDERDLPSEDEVARRIGERLTVTLENRLRETSTLRRERLERFVPVVRQLVEDGEPELLALLLDEVHQQNLQAPPQPAPSADDEAPVEDDSAKDVSGKKGGSGKGRRHKRRRSTH